MYLPLLLQYLRNTHYSKNSQPKIETLSQQLLWSNVNPDVFTDERRSHNSAKIFHFLKITIPVEFLILKKILYIYSQLIGS